MFIISHAFSFCFQLNVVKWYFLWANKFFNFVLLSFYILSMLNGCHDHFLFRLISMSNIKIWRRFYMQWRKAIPKYPNSFYIHWNNKMFSLVILSWYKGRDIVETIKNPRERVMHFFCYLYEYPHQSLKTTPYCLYLHIIFTSFHLTN